MSRSFNNTSDVAGNSAPPVTTTPYTMACWFNFSSTTLYCPLMCLAVNNVALNDRATLYAAGNNPGDPILALSSSGVGDAFASSASGYSASTWMHAAGVWASATSRTAYLNGTAGTTETTNKTPTTFDIARVGCEFFGAANRFGDGAATCLIAEAGIWNVALGSGEIQALAKGLSPKRVRPGNLVAYWPLWGLHSPEPSMKGGATSLTLTGTSAANHAPVILSNIYAGDFDDPPLSVSEWLPWAIRELEPEPELLEAFKTILISGALFPGSSGPGPGGTDWQPYAILDFDALADERADPGSLTIPAGLFPSGRRIFPTLVPWDHRADQKTKVHEKTVAAMLNSLLRRGDLIQTDQVEWKLGYGPANSGNWAGDSPETLTEALDRIAAALAALGQRP